jgi:hypothetical protein
MKFTLLLNILKSYKSTGLNRITADLIQAESKTICCDVYCINTPVAARLGGLQPFRKSRHWNVLFHLELNNCHSSERSLIRSQRSRGLSYRSTAARLLRLWVRIPPGAWTFVCCVLSSRGLCDGLITCPEESYRLWRVVCDQETSRMRRLKPATGLWKIQPHRVVTPRKQTNSGRSLIRTSVSRSVVCDHTWGYVISWETEGSQATRSVVQRSGRKKVWALAFLRCDEAESSLNPNISNIDCSIPATDLYVCDQVRVLLYFLIREVRLLKMGPIGCPEMSVKTTTYAA